MTRDDAEEATQALGQVLSGGWRTIALYQRLGVPQALGLSTQDWVQRRLGGYVRLSIEERREAVEELMTPADEGGQGMTTREAASVLGVAQTTVVTDAAARERNGSAARPTRESRRGPSERNGSESAPAEAAPPTQLALVEGDAGAGAPQGPVAPEDVAAPPTMADVEARLGPEAREQLNKGKVRRQLADGVAAMALVVLLRPDDVAEAIDERRWDEVRRVAERTAAWFEAIGRARADRAPRLLEFTGARE